MAVSYVGVSNAAAESAGTTTTATTVSVTPTMPAGTVEGNRVFVSTTHSGTASGATPAGWTAVFKDTTVGSGAVAAGGGLRRASVYFRDYDGQWTMAAFTVASAAQNSHAVAAVSVSKPDSESWDVPSFSTNAEFFGTAGTAYTGTTGSSFTTHTGAILIATTVENDLVTMASPTISGGGGGLGAITERADGGTATGNDVAIQVHTIPVTTGGAGTITHAGTLSAASQGGTIVVEQSTTAWSGPQFKTRGTWLNSASAVSPANVAIPAGVTTDDIIVAVMYVESTAAITPPAGFTVAGDSPVIIGASFRIHVWWKRQTSATGAGETTGSYAFTYAGTLYRDAVAFRFNNCITSGDPFDVTASAVDTSTSTANIAAVSDTTTVANTMLVYAAGDFNGGTYSGPTGFTARHNRGAQFGLFTEEDVSAGATGSITSVSSNVGSNGSWLGALEPVAAVAAEPLVFETYQVAVQRATLY